NAAGLLRTLVFDLLAYSQVSTRVAHFGRIDLGRVVTEVLADLDVAISDAAAVIDVGALSTIDADELEMRQLMQNLIGNAIKYRRVDTPPQVRITAERPRGPVCSIVIADNGIGFRQVYAEKVFKMF